MKKLCSILMAVVIMMMSLAGCGSSTTKEETKDQGQETTKEETAKEETAKEVEDIELTVWGPAEDQAEESGNWIGTVCDKFNAEHPEWNITYKYGVCSEGEAKNKVTQDVEGSADIYMFANDQVNELTTAQGIAKLGGSTLDEIKASNSEAIIKSVTVDDSVYGIPFTTNTWFMYYDKSIYSEDDIKTLETMVDKGVVAFPLSNSWYLASFYVANGCTLFGEEGTDEEAGIDFGGDKAVAVTNYLVDLAKNPNFKNDADGLGIAGLADGSVSAIFSGSWDAAAIKELLGENMGIAKLPTININGEQKQLKSFAGSKAVAINPTSKNPAVAVALAKYLAAPESQYLHYQLRSIVPCNTELLKEPKIQEDELVVAQNETFDTTSIMQPFVPAMGNYWTPAENMGKEILNGEVTHENAAEKTASFNESVNMSMAE